LSRCKPCIEEIPYFEAFIEKYQQAKIEVVLCSLDIPNQLESKLFPFVALSGF
jgi:hypothetical protein